MATIANTQVEAELPPSGSPLAQAIDRWIYVYMAASFVVVTLTGFIPDSIGLLADAKSGAIPPLPLVLHFHAVLMGSFLLLVLAQTTLAATGRIEGHRQLGRVAMVLVPALVLVGFVLVPTIYRSVWFSAQSAPLPARAQLQHVVLRLDNIMLFQLRIGVLFPLFIFLGLRARKHDYAFHKRMMILATGIALPAAINRMTWLPATLPASPLSADLYMLLVLSPMFVWDVIRNHIVSRAYLVWLGTYFLASIPLYLAWGQPWWQVIAPRVMGL